MSIALKDQDFQALCHKFGLPDLVQKWLSSTQNRKNEYTIHEDLCNMHPEDALLCIALCLKIIETKYSSQDSLIEPLLSTIDSIIMNYGEIALQRLGIEPSQNERVDIEFVAADLRDLSRGLENIEPYLFESDDDTVSYILSALSIQAGAQAEVAAYVLTSFKEQEKRNKEFKGEEIPYFKTFPVNDNRSAR